MTVFTSNGSIVIPANAINVTIKLAGARGGSGGDDAGYAPGAGGGGRVGTFRLADYTARTLTFNIGRQGSNGVGSQSNAAGGAGGSGVASGGTGGRAGPSGSSGGGGGGGGATGVYDSFSNRWIIVAGGGGGGGGAAFPDVPGLTGAAGLGWAGSGGTVRTISNGGTGGSCPTDGSGGGGGGGGASGGAGGPNGFDRSTGNVNASGGGGGGSGYDATYATWTGDTGVNFTDGYVEVTYAEVFPSVDSFSVSPTAIVRGQTANLSWTTSNATSVSIDQGVGGVPVDGNTNVSPVNTTTYTLTATGPGNFTRTAQTVLTVYIPPIVTLSLARNSIIVGESTTLSWTTTGDADNISITPGITNQNLNSFSTVSPTSTTTYVANVSGRGGSDSDSITLTVYQRPTASISGPSSLNYGQQGTVTYSASYANTSLSVTPTYYYDSGTVVGSPVNFPLSSSAEAGQNGVNVSGSFSTQIPYTITGPRRVTYTINAAGSGGTASADAIIDIIIDETPSNVIIPETEEVFKLQDPIVTPDIAVTSSIISIDDIDIPVEVKSDRPIKVDVNGQNNWRDLRRI